MLFLLMQNRNTRGDFVFVGAGLIDLLTSKSDALLVH